MDCRLCSYLDTLNDEDRAALEDLIGQARQRAPQDRNPLKPGVNTIRRVIRHSGEPMSLDSVRRHVQVCP